MFRVVRRRRPYRRASRVSKKEFAEHKEAARELVLKKLAYWAPHAGVAPKKVFIKNSRSRWGSCSQLGNLNFNYRVVKLSSELLDYVIVHELCHLIHFNHSRAFWGEVEKHLPQWRSLRRQLRTVSMKMQ